MFVLVSNHFWKYFSVNAGVWLRMENKFSGKYFRLTVCFSWFDPEMVWSENFHFKSFPDSRVKTKRERERGKYHAFDFDFAPITLRSRLRLRTNCIEIAPIAPQDRIDLSLSRSGAAVPCWFDEFFLVGFCFCVYLLRNCIICLFGSWENVRKMWGTSRNVFSILFSAIQPNTRKYFSKHFLECN